MGSPLWDYVGVIFLGDFKPQLLGLAARFWIRVAGWVLPSASRNVNSVPQPEYIGRHMLLRRVEMCFLHKAMQCIGLCYGLGLG